MILPYSVVNPLTVVEVARRLPRPGEVLVREGERVEPFQVVAESDVPPDFCIVNVARDLGLPPKRVKGALRATVGQEVESGDVLASRGGLGGRVCRAPFQGTITGYGRGRLLLEAETGRLQLTALVPGTVIQVWGGRGVLIETRGGFIQGAWGNDKEAFGVLRIVVRAPRHPLRAKRLDASAQGAVVVGGSGLDEETIEQAIELQVRGIVVGGVPPSLLPRLRDLDFPVIATEGVGATPMSDATFSLLRSLDGREVAVSGRLRTRWNSERPFLLIPTPSQAASAVNPETPLEIGARVRALRLPYLGQSGTVTELPTGMITLQTGARLHGAQVDFDGETGLVPFPNLEQLL
ncbi:MAG: hypothetical protein ACLFU8_04595 [Anaerolineales bacterium]